MILNFLTVTLRQWLSVPWRGIKSEETSKKNELKYFRKNKLQGFYYKNMEVIANKKVKKNKFSELDKNINNKQKKCTIFLSVDMNCAR